MSDTDLAGRVEALEVAVSGEAGRLFALSAAVRGFLIVAGGLPEVRQAVEQELQRSYAADLATSLNETAVSSFQLEVEMIRAALLVAQGRSIAPPDAPPPDQTPPRTAV